MVYVQLFGNHTKGDKITLIRGLYLFSSFMYNSSYILIGHLMRFPVNINSHESIKCLFLFDAKCAASSFLVPRGLST